MLSQSIAFLYSSYIEVLRLLRDRIDMLGLFKEISMLIDKPLLTHKGHYYFLHGEL